MDCKTTTNWLNLRTTVARFCEVYGILHVNLLVSCIVTWQYLRFARQQLEASPQSWAFGARCESSPVGIVGLSELCSIDLVQFSNLMASVCTGAELWVGVLGGSGMYVVVCSDAQTNKNCISGL